MFVCHGNICRSPTAKGIFNHLAAARNVADKFWSDSCGVIGFHSGESPHRTTQQVAKAHGIRLDHRAQQAHHTHFDQYALFLTMDRSNFHNLLSMAPDKSASRRIQMFRDWDPKGRGDVPDPYYDSERGFEIVFDIIYRTCDNLLTSIINGTSTL